MTKALDPALRRARKIGRTMVQARIVASAMAAICVATGGSLFAASYVEIALGGGFRASLVGAALFGMLLLLVGIAMAADIARRAFFMRAGMTDVKSNYSRRKVLIMGISHLENDEDHDRVANSAKYGYADLTQPAKDGDPNHGKWQQNLRAIEAQRGALQRVIVLPSRESATQFQKFEDYISDVLSRDEQEMEFAVEIAADDEDGVDYENFDAVYAAIERCVRQANAEPHDICIDATAGQKIFSIAAASQTANSDMLFGYVTTGFGSKGGHRKFFDMQTYDLIEADVLPLK